MRKLDPELAKARMIKAGCQPLVPYTNAKTKWKSRCLQCGKIVYPRLIYISMGQNLCGHGIPKSPKMTKNHISVKRTYSNEKAIQIMLDAGVTPLENYKWRKQDWKCKCMTCGEIVFPRLANVLEGHNPCRYCASYGINMKNSSYLYLITNFGLNAHKVGIGNNKKNRDRLKSFNKAGWETYKVWQFHTGKDALQVESDIFRILRKDLKFPVFLNKDQMSNLVGHSETIDADSITLLELEKIIKKVIKGYRINP